VPEKPKEVVVEPDRNEALEGQRAGEAVFKAIFGDDSDEDD
jgi:G patch domain-containing protein 1